jgi:pyruvate/2-oxoglutarate dehydrogenase complex dihydrolipoamide dehydrogenase (E3) component
VLYATGRTPNTAGLGLEALALRSGRPARCRSTLVADRRAVDLRVGDVTDRVR